MASELRTRSIVGVALIALALGALLAGGLLFWLLLVVAGVLMQGEWGDLTGATPEQRKAAMFAVSIPLALLCPLAAGIDWPVLVAGAAAFFFVAFTSRRPALALGIPYVCLPVTALLFLRGEQPYAYGLLLAFWALGLVWATDIGAYFAGRAIGGPKLAPRVSPSKTWAGLAGGVLAALVLGFLLHRFAGLPIQLAAASLNNMDLGMDQGGGGDSVTREGVLPDDMSAFLAGGYIDGKAQPMRSIMPMGRDKFDGWYVALGVEKAFGDTGVVGLSASFSEVKGNTAASDWGRARLYQGTVYGAFDLGGLKLDAVGSAGTMATRSRRAFAVGATPYTLYGSDQELALSGEIGLSKALGDDGFSIVPRAALRGAYISSGNLAEYGGDAALVIHRHAIQSAQGRLGATAKADRGGFRPYLTANYVHEFRDQPAFLQANLIGGTGPLAPFALGGQDKNWAEIGGGLTVTTGNVDISLSADTTAWRSDVEYQSYRASLKFRF